MFMNVFDIFVKLSYLGNSKYFWKLSDYMRFFMTILQLFLFNVLININAYCNERETGFMQCLAVPYRILNSSTRYWYNICMYRKYYIYIWILLRIEYLTLRYSGILCIEWADSYFYSHWFLGNWQSKLS